MIDADIEDYRRQTKPLRRVERIERDPHKPGWARLWLSCGHVKDIDPCFRQICDVEGCANA